MALNSRLQASAGRWAASWAMLCGMGVNVTAAVPLGCELTKTLCLYCFCCYCCVAFVHPSLQAQAPPVLLLQHLPVSHVSQLGPSSAATGPHQQGCCRDNTRTTSMRTNSKAASSGVEQTPHWASSSSNKGSSSSNSSTAATSRSTTSTLTSGRSHTGEQQLAHQRMRVQLPRVAL